MQAVIETDPKASVAIGGRRISVRTLIFLAGITFWIGNTILNTGSAGIAALWSSLLFLAEIIILTSATRTIHLNQVPAFYCWGGVMLTLVWLAGYAFTIVEPDKGALSWNFFAPFMEESLKLAPVAFFLWRQRRARLWSMAASDLLLLAAASGAGFGLVEDAFIQHKFGLWHAVNWLPTTAVLGGSLTVGHQTWTSLAGATLGLALLWRPRKPFVYLLGASGFLWSMLDHFGNNIVVGRSGFLLDFLTFIRSHGWLSLYLFWIALVVVIASDLNAIHRALPPLPELKTPFADLFTNRARPIWEFLLTKRALAFVALHYRQEPPAVRSGQLEPILYGLSERAAELRSGSKSSPPPPAGPNRRPGFGVEEEDPIGLQEDRHHRRGLASSANAAGAQHSPRDQGSADGTAESFPS
ncbi:MAG TPA: PrsW family glutamic-type intramembrane protease [Candidatus Limnocylindrales bacterium]|nr:PrsW family glutamic-type intramembrane protease [Candidatus Limnocylindrales bacterium]